MKKTIIAFMLLLLIKGATANSVTIKLFNNSNATIACSNLKIHNGSFGVKDHGNPFHGKTYGPGTHLEYSSGSASAFCGTDGYVEFQTNINNKTYQFLISFDNPFIGTNSYSASASYPFQITHLNGGPGSDMVLSFELSGGPQITAATPPPPIAIDAGGRKTITGKFSWNINETGLPADQDLTKAFTITIKAPAIFNIDATGRAAQWYQGKQGWFGNITELQNVKITYTDSRTINANRNNQAPNPLSPQRTIHFMVSNLPEDVPLSITAVPTDSKWNKGKDIPEIQNPNIKWMAFILEKSKTDNTIIYDVAAAWFDGAGNYGGNTNGGLRSEIAAQLKNRRPQSDFGNQADFRKRNLIRPTQNIEKSIPINDMNGIDRQNINIRKQKNVINKPNNN
jgi:hypothetical protein